MKFKILTLFFAIAVLASCSKDANLVSDLETQTPDPSTPLSRSELNKIVETSLFRENTPFDWNKADAHTVWSGLMQGEQIMSIGYKPANVGDISRKLHEINLKDAAWLGAKNKVLNTVLENERKTQPNLELKDILYVANETLPYVMMKVTALSTIEALRALPEVRYAEVAGYDPEGGDQRSDSGCGVSPNYSIPSADYTTVTPGGKVPWNYSHMNIQNAWSYSQGAGITVGLIDTGVSQDQNKMGSQYSSGYSTGRSIQKYSTHYSGMWWWTSLDSPHDQCGHGTQMAGLIASPRTSAGNTVGVAYKANLIAYRGTTDVVVNASDEIEGVSNATIALANNSSLKLISQSIGDVFSHGQWEDAIDYAYYSKGKMIISAGGTSLSWTSWYGVIFPASLNETVAVTGIRDNYTQRCNTCHSGSKIDFTAVMQRASNTDRTSLTLTLSGDVPTYVGGSSCATATTAGIAALIWARNPSRSRSQVYNIMKNAAQYKNARHSEFGWGVINALSAVQAP
jgi:serine protease